MQVTKDNYSEYFEGLMQDIHIIEDCGNSFAKDIVSKLKIELAGQQKGAEELMSDNSILKIGVVGQVKAGKSSFLNSLFFDGENVLPRASTPMTAGLTILEYGEESKFIVEYYNTKEWQTFVDQAKEYDDCIEAYKSNLSNGLSDSEIVKQAEQNIPIAIKTAKELVSRCSNQVKSKIKDVALTEERSFNGTSDLQDILEQYVGADGQYTSIVKCLIIQINDERLKDLRIVDTPGVNDPVVSREQRTREFLRSCHGVFFLSYSGHFFDSTDVDFLENRIGGQGVGTIVLIASKFDSVLQDEGKKFENDLEGAINHCQRQLKSQFRNNLSTCGYNGKEPIVDFSSGIGFSIFKKNPSSWDDMERHVVSRMKVYYPDFFSTDEDVREMFYNLSQMDSIRTDYLEKVFVQNKDNIIAEKVSAYFGNMSEEMHKLVKQNTLDLSTKLEVLRSTDINDLEVKKQATQKAIISVEKGISSVSERLKSRAETSKLETLNAGRFSAPSIPVKTLHDEFYRISTVVGRNKTFEVSYDMVDVNALIDKLNKESNNVCVRITNAWKKSVDELKSFLIDSIDKMIKDEEQKDTSGQFDADILRNIMYEIVDKIKSVSMIDVNTLLSEFESVCNDSLQGVDSLGYTKKEFQGEDAEARRYVRELADRCRQKARNIISQLSGSFNSSLADALNKASKNVIAVVVDNKREFIETMTNKSNEFISELEEQLAKKQENVQSLETALQALNSFESKL